MFGLLNETEVRVLASLAEKSVTTPEYYPLTLNALVNACNQKSNREPVVEYQSGIVGDALDSLKERGLVRVRLGDGRVPKYQHYFEEGYKINSKELAILCELMLRGPQTGGELRTRTERFNENMELSEVDTILQSMASREFPLVIKLPKQPGRRENRYMHLLAGDPPAEMLAGTDIPESIIRPSDRIAALEAVVETLRNDLNALREDFDKLKAELG
ncbi:MAG: YceH family protein [bacterium]